MPVDRSAALADIDDVLATQFSEGGTSASTKIAALHSAAIERWAPDGSSYRKMLVAIGDVFGVKDRAYMKTRAILEALRRDYDKDKLATFEQVVHASIHDDLLTQAEYLIEGSFLLAAAVVAGASLEEHIKLMAAANGVSLVEPDRRKPGKMRPREASTLRDELYAQKKVVTAGERSQLQAWMDLRNEAAHNKPEFQNRTSDEIERMRAGIRDFIVKHPA